MLVQREQGSVTELRLALSYGAIDALVHGAEIVFDMQDDEGVVRVMLRLDDDAVMTIRQRIEQAMLHLLPVGQQRH